MDSPRIEVTTELDGAELHVGTLRLYVRRGEVTTFQYAEEYLVHPRAYAIDPRSRSLPGCSNLYPGRCSSTGFSDASPDRWGQSLMRRAERDRAAAARSAPRALGMVDFLVGVPKMVSAGHLLHASENLDEKDDPRPTST